MSLYRKRARGAPQTTFGIVLDLDSTLICTQDEVELSDLGILRNPAHVALRRRIYHLSAPDVESKRGTGENYKFWGSCRPHAFDFLDFCFDYFETVVVWSAGRPRYVEALVDFLFKDLPHPDLVLTREDCVPSYERGTREEILEKPLTKVVARFAAGPKRPRLAGLLALDDNPTTFAGPNPDNAILIPRYEPEPTVEELASMADDALLRTQDWLLEPATMAARDVRRLDKSRIFA